MYSSRPNLILGFHGCEAEDQQKLLTGIKYFKKSQERYDWLGHGMYFWENNPLRAELWAKQKAAAGTLKDPALIGAIIDLGHCLDLLDSGNISLVKNMYDLFQSDSEKIGKPIPVNKDHPSGDSSDKVLRFLDCAVIEYMHSFLEKNNEQSFDSIRAIFMEGDPLYPGAGFKDKTHIQICITNPNCIKGFFLPRKINTRYEAV